MSTRLEAGATMSRAWNAARPAAGDEYVERARGLAPLIEASVEEIERQRRLPPALLDALFDAGLFRLLVPRSLGGAELDPVTLVRVMEDVAGNDASTAWRLCQASGCSMPIERATGTAGEGPEPSSAASQRGDQR